MAYDERKIIAKAMERISEEFFSVLNDLVEAYPDVARRGAQAFLAPKIEPADTRRMREAFASAETPEEFMAMLESAIAHSSEQEVLEALVPRRRTEENDADRFGIP